jgi:hypothetical protein
MATSKAKVQSLAWPLISVAIPNTAYKAHEMARVPDEVASRGQKQIRKLLRNNCIPVLRSLII